MTESKPQKPTAKLIELKRPPAAKRGPAKEPGVNPGLIAARKANAERKAKGLPIGRPKGQPNQLTTKVRGSLVSVFDALGGDKAFAAWAKKNPTQFYNLYAKSAPKQKEANLDTGVTVILQGTSKAKVQHKGQTLEMDQDE